MQLPVVTVTRYAIIHNFDSLKGSISRGAYPQKLLSFCIAALCNQRLYYFKLAHIHGDIFYAPVDLSVQVAC